MLAWAHTHYFLTFLLLCIAIPIYAIVLVGLVEITFKAINRILRTIKVVCRGWPPPGLDADGDVIVRFEEKLPGFPRGKGK